MSGDSTAVLERATVSLVIFKVGAHKLALPTTVVRRVLPAVEITPLPEAPRAVRGVINVQGVIMPVYDLRKHLALSDRDVLPSDFLILVWTEARELALLVEEVCDVTYAHQTATKPDNLPGLDQGREVIVIAGEIILIQNLERLLSDDENKVLQDALNARNG